MGLLVVVTATACVPRPSDGESDTATSSSSVEFVGTPAEYNLAILDCLERGGWQVAVEADGALAIADGDDEAFAAYQDCRSEVGVQPMSDLSEAELQRRYDWRPAQYQCMVDAGITVGEPMSLETFVDGHERTGTPAWAPSEALSDADAAAAVQACPYSTEEW